MRRCRWFLYAVFLLLPLAFSLFSPVVVLGYSDAEASQALRDAHQTITDCYLAAVEAEKAGANITGLVRTLNRAGDLYSRAVLAYGYGDYDLTVHLCDECRDVLNGFVSEAYSLEVSASEERQRDFLLNVVGSSVGAVVVVSVSFALWSLLKKKYKDEGSE